MLFSSQLFLVRTDGNGRRLISWRLWVLIWVAPVLFGLAAVLMLGQAGYLRLASVPGEGEVVRVYAWEGETPFDRGRINYGPVFRYDWSDGQPTDASLGQSHPDWNFEIGSRHAIRYLPGVKANVMLPGWHNWAAGLIILAIGAVLTLPALWATVRLRRWQRAGA